MVEAATASGVEFLPIPENYYVDLAARYDLAPELLERMQAQGVLYDRTKDGEFFHIYTRTFEDRFFFEIVERHNYDLFGAANTPVRLAAQASLTDERETRRSLVHSEGADPMITGETKLIAHVGYPTTTFKSPMIYNPWFERRGVNAVVMPLGVRSQDFAAAFPQICRFTNFHGALITMPHKVAVMSMLDEVSKAVMVAGSCNAVRRGEDGRLIGDMFDGEGFVRGVARNGGSIAGKRALIVGTGGVGSAIAASCAAAGAEEIGAL